MRVRGTGKKRRVGRLVVREVGAAADHRTVWAGRGRHLRMELKVSRIEHDIGDDLCAVRVVRMGRTEDPGTWGAYLMRVMLHGLLIWNKSGAQEKDLDGERGENRTVEETREISGREWERKREESVRTDESKVRDGGFKKG